MKNFTFHSKKDDKTNVRVTVTAVLENDTAKFGVSRCSRKDQFVRKSGRILALERAETNPIMIFRVPKTHEPIKWFVSIAKDLAEQVKANPQMLSIS